MADRDRLCFVCCSPVIDKTFEPVRASMNHSHAPLLVLLSDVLGYKLEENRLHSQVGYLGALSLKSPSAQGLKFGRCTVCSLWVSGSWLQISYIQLIKIYQT